MEHDLGYVLQSLIQKDTATTILNWCAIWFVFASLLLYLGAQYIRDDEKFGIAVLSMTIFVPIFVAFVVGGLYILVSIVKLFWNL